jgi:type I restriction enzyme S subunit
MKLADVCKTFTSGGTPSRKRSDYFENGTIPWIRTKELNDGLISEAAEFITLEAIKNSSAKMLPKDTVLLAMYGATVGKLGVLGFESSCNQACAAMVPKDGVVDYRFLYYLLLNHRDLIVSQATGGAQQNLSGELIKGFTFDFPTYEEQKAISEVLWQLDEKIAANKVLSKTLEDIAQTIFKSWFIDFDPVKAKMAGETPVGMDAETAALFPDSMEESELGPIPKSWKVETLGEFCPFSYGKSLPASTREHGGIAVFGSNGVVGSHSQALTDRASIIVGRKGTVGTVNLAIEPCWPIDTAFFSQTADERDVCFAYELLKSLPLQDMNSDAAVPGLNRENAHRLDFALPPETLLERFAFVADPMFRLANQLHKQNLALQNLRDTLLPRLISGELEIPTELLPA